MSRGKLALVSLMLVAACSGNPIGTGGGGGGGGGGGSSATVPAEIAVNLRSIVYNPRGSGTLKVDMDGLTASPQTATFVRNKALDVNGYRAFTYQETGLQRTHLALVSDNFRKTLRAGVVSDGGQFNRHFGGGTFARIAAYSAPPVRAGVETGEFSYAGSYAGVFVSGNASNPSLPSGLTPYKPLRVQGTALINANFANDLVNGGVSNRWLLDDAGNRVDMNDDNKITVDDQLAQITFPSTEIDKDGKFLGDVEFFGEPGTVIGKVGGLFGGRGATDIAGAIVINPIEGETGIWEYGVFNLPRCDLAGASPLCDPR